MRSLCLVLIFLVTGCSAPSIVQQPEDRYWHLEGKLSVRFEGKSRVVSLDWRQTGDSSDIQLTGPLGSGKVLLSVRDDEIWLDEGEGPQRVEPSQALTLTDSGLDLPWQDLSYWVRGLVGPSGQRLPESFEQGSWRISILRRSPDGPELMTFEHPDIDLRLRVKSLSGII